MTMFQLYAIAAPFNAFIWCAFIIFFLKNFRLNNKKRVIATFSIYVFLAFSQCAGGNGIFNLDMSVFNILQFALYVFAGFCVCAGIYCFYERGEIGKRIEAKREAKKGK